MQLTINNLGQIKYGKIQLNNLTILVGDNNSGKTYITYSIYGLLKNWADFISDDCFNPIVERLETNGQIILQKAEILALTKDAIGRKNGRFEKRIKDLFNDTEGVFEDALVELEYELPTDFSNAYKQIGVGNNIHFEGIVLNDTLTINFTKEIDHQIDIRLFKRVLVEIFSALIFQDIFPTPTIITAERLGISLFYKELDEKRTDMLQKLQAPNEVLQPFELLTSKSAYYTIPTRDHIAFTRSLGISNNGKSTIDTTYPISIIHEILGGDFKKDSKQDIRFFSKNNDNSRFDIPIYLASSSARCVVDIYFYLQNLATKGDILIIDEPESHLTLKNQRLFAKLIAAIINCNIKVFITTHSDFLIKEINNLILLSNSFEHKEEWIAKNNHLYSGNDFIEYQQVSVYQANEGRLDQLKVTNKGIEVPFFDNEINSLFLTASDLDYLIE